MECTLVESTCKPSCSPKVEVETSRSEREKGEPGAPKSARPSPQVEGEQLESPHIVYKSRVHPLWSATTSVPLQLSHPSPASIEMSSATPPEREPAPAANPNLFHNVHFYINDSLPLGIRDKVQLRPPLLLTLVTATRDSPRCSASAQLLASARGATGLQLPHNDY